MSKRCRVEVTHFVSSVFCPKAVEVSLQTKFQRVILKYIDPSHQFADGIGYFVGIDQSNPYFTVQFFEDHLVVWQYPIGKQRIGFDSVLAVRLPGAHEIPKVVSWAEGYFMAHEAVLETNIGEISILGGVNSAGKSDVYSWHNFVSVILTVTAKQRKDPNTEQQSVDSASGKRFWPDIAILWNQDHTFPAVSNVALASGLDFFRFRDPRDFLRSEVAPNCRLVVCELTMPYFDAFELRRELKDRFGENQLPTMVVALAQADLLSIDPDVKKLGMNFVSYPLIHTPWDEVAEIINQTVG